MLFKIILAVLIIAMLVSLSGALRALFQSNSKKIHDWLIIRVAIAVAIIITVALGFYTGDLSISAPWTGQY